MKTSALLTLMLGLGLRTLPGLAQAQPDAGQILREQQQGRPAMPSPAPDIGLPPATRPPARVPQGAAVRVNAFRFSGDLGDIGEKALQDLVKDDAGKELRFDQLQQVTDRVSQYLRDRGYSSARAYLPAQEIRGGVVNITILLGRIEGNADGSGILVTHDGIALKLDDKLHLRLQPRRIRKTVAAATVARSPFLKMDTLERGLLLLNDLPGIQARARLDPGDTPGTTRISVDVNEGPLLTGSAALDNFGNRYTGATRLSTQASLNDPAGIGDQAIMQASVADGVQLARLGYSLPLGDNGLRLSGSYTGLNYRIGKELEVLDAKGSAGIAGASLAYPLIRSRSHSLFGSLGYERKALRDQSLGTVTADKRVNAWSLAFNGNAVDGLGGGGLDSYGLTVSRGDLELSRNASSEAGDSAGPKAQGAYTKTAFSLARLQRLPGNWSLYATLTGQLADRNLDSSEKFLLGGASGIRAYPSGEGSGDEGWLTNLELRYDVPGSAGTWQLLAFYDTGGITQHKTTWTGWDAGNPGQPNRYRLSGAGFGIHLAKSGSYFIGASYAWKLGSNPGRGAAGLDADGTNDNGRFWLQSLIFF